MRKPDILVYNHNETHNNALSHIIKEKSKQKTVLSSCYIEEIIELCMGKMLIYLKKRKLLKAREEITPEDLHGASYY